MELKNDDAEMARIYHESLHPKGYSEDSKFGKNQKQRTVRNPYRQDVHANVSKYSANKKTVKYSASETKNILSVMTIVGIIILTLLFILLPMFIAS